MTSSESSVASFHPRSRRGALSFAILAALALLTTAALAADTLLVREALGVTLPRRMAVTVLPATPLDPWLTGSRTKAPRQGEAVRAPDGTEAAWERITVDSTGWFSESERGPKYVAVTINRPAAVRMLLEGMGNDIAWVNGVLHAGNPYQQKDKPDPWEPRFDYSRIPVDLHQGENLLLFRYSRGRFKVRLVPLPAPVFLNTRDLTLPDAVTGSPLESWASVAVVNAGNTPLEGFSLLAAPEGRTPDTLAVPELTAMGVRKVAFKVKAPPRQAKGEILVRLTLLARAVSSTDASQSGKPGARSAADTATIRLRVVGPNDNRRETFISGIDGSVQYYAVLPPEPGNVPDHPALFLSLHGAGVEAINQTGSYEPKSWGYVVAPTNRRPYGFSWEDWGRLDALEVLDIAKKKFNIDESRVYLTGHSMGGHGTWFMGATYPDKFAAIGPSAGWITFRSYRFPNAPEETSAVRNMFLRATKPSDLFALADNYRHYGVYILHGTLDDNVPIEQAKMMVERLTPIHKDFVFYQQPGAGHWWDNSPEPGADCVDWRPMFDFFARHARPGPDRIRTVEFTTANPGISARDSWLTIDAQEHQLELSTARVYLDPGLRQVKGTTANVARLSLDRDLFRGSDTATALLDSQKTQLRLDNASTGSIWLEKTNGQWKQTTPPPAGVKNARRYGTFKEAFRNRMALVYGTAGSAGENAWARERARFDAEYLWYQGNASVDVLSDREFNPSGEPDRNVVLYGNSKTNRLWKTLLSGSPVQVDPGRITLGTRTVKGSDICCLFVRPRPGSDVASVGVVSGTGLEGFNLTHLVMYLEPGLGLPDVTAFNPDLLTAGNNAVLLTGFFGLDWSMGSGEFVGTAR